MRRNEFANRSRIAVDPKNPIPRAKSLGDLERMSTTSKGTIDNHQWGTAWNLRTQSPKPLAENRFE